MASDESKKNRILDFSFEKFSTEGITHVTMDDISRGVGIGKGTLYKFFPSKEALLLATIEYVVKYIEKSIDVIMKDESLNPMEKLSTLIKLIGKRIARIKPTTIEYMERCFPEAFQKIIEARERIILNNMMRIFEEGKKMGHFNPDTDVYLLTHILIGAANHITNSKVLLSLNYSLDNLFGNITSTVLRGCLTEEGRELLYQSGSTNIPK